MLGGKMRGRRAAIGQDAHRIVLEWGVLTRLLRDDGRSIYVFFTARDFQDTARDFQDAAN